MCFLKMSLHDSAKKQPMVGVLGVGYLGLLDCSYALPFISSHLCGLLILSWS
ncbi:hypothetical protein BJX68DRAFT_230745 [Aspergillus pseudodeflectus]|uniref:Uncharacterized protein n=1 Tax=Aspergillus pseudodeflectus TaxID=176178 RepID=A0ABR4KTD4_9EURO